MINVNHYDSIQEKARKFESHAEYTEANKVVEKSSRVVKWKLVDSTITAEKVQGGIEKSCMVQPKCYHGNIVDLCKSLFVDVFHDER